MKQLKINKIIIKDWCIFEDFEVDCGHTVNIKGDNETGKSRLGSAITWVLNGTDIDGNALSDVLPTYRERELSPSVKLEMSVTDEQGLERPVTIEKILKAQFNRAKEFTGSHDIVIMLNGVKSTATALKNWIESNVCDAEVFNMLSNIKVFTEKLKVSKGETVWQRQRRIAESLLKDIPEEYAAVQLNPDYELIKSGVLQHGSAQMYLKEIKTNLSTIQKAIEEYPIQLETIKGKIVDLPFTAEQLKSSEANINKKIADLIQENNLHRERQVSDENVNLADEYAIILNELNTLQREFDVASEKHIANRARIEGEIGVIQSYTQDLRTRYTSKQQEAKGIETLTYEDYLKQAQKKCKTCGTVLSNPTEENYSEYKNNITESIKKELEDIAVSGKSKKDEAAKLKIELDSLVAPRKSSKIEKLAIKADDVAQKMGNVKTVEDLEGFSEQLQGLQDTLKGLAEDLHSIKVNDGYTQELTAMQARHKQTLKSKSELQQKFDLCKEFIAERCDNLEAQINSLFEGTDITFKMFRENKTNDGVQETFEIYFKGKEYHSQLSLSTKTIVSYMITLILQKAYGVMVPLVIDNMESVHWTQQPEMQSFILTRIEENCPKCGTGGYNRRNVNGEWNCCNCGNVWAKKLEVTTHEL